MAARNWRVAVVGAGPAGLYGVDALVKKGAAVDVFETLFAPFGLVRYGVAPDHPKIKRTGAVFERILGHPDVRLFANVAVGRDVSVDELLSQYDQVLISMGSAGARALGISGEDLAGSFSATELVNWYNGHPDFQDLSPPLDHPRAVVIGMGNVAIDVARILVRDPGELASTDISDAALVSLRKSQVKEVILLARRGPNQAAFDEKEVRELAALEGVELGIDGYVSKRLTKMSEFIAAFPRASDLIGEKRVILRFCASPAALLGEGRVSRIKIERNDLVESAAQMRAVGSGEFAEIDAGLVVRAIGYSGKALPGVPFCENTGTIPNTEGRVLTEPDGTVIERLYVAGWIKRGPTGLIGTNKSCAVDTVTKMEQDLDQVGPERDLDAIVSLLTERGVRFINKEEWARLDALELSQGKDLGKARQKFTTLKEALDALADAPSPDVHSNVRATVASSKAG